LKLLVINPNTSQFVTDKLSATVSAAADSGVKVTAVTGRKGPPIVGTRAECAIAAVEAMELAVEHGQDADAILLGISFDTGLDAIREVMPMPVVGMSEAGMLAATTLARSFSMVTFGDRAVPIYDELIAHYRLSGRSAGTVSLPPLSLQELQDPMLIVDRLAAKINQTAAQNGAESVVLAGAVFAGIAPVLKDRVSIPVVDGIVAGVGLLQMLHQLNTAKPKQGSYRYPAAKTLTGMSDAMTRHFQELPD